jgi:hypothetical protein
MNLLRELNRYVRSTQTTRKEVGGGSAMTFRAETRRAKALIMALIPYRVNLF